MRPTAYPGKSLRERREERGLTTGEVYRQIHVPPRYLNALERGDFTQLPEETYAMGFLTTYCRFLELDPDPFIAALQEHCNPITKPGRFAPKRADDILRRPLRMADVATWSAICALLLLAWFTFNTVTQPFTEGEENRVDASTLTAPEQEPFDSRF